VMTLAEESVGQSVFNGNPHTGAEDDIAVK
jgi:hypothetical protein